MDDPAADDEARSAASDADSFAGTDDQSAPGGSEPRRVVVPSRVYKSVTVFSTLFAVVAVVGGFVVLDLATKRASVSLAEADPLLGLLGLGLIALGAVTYAFSTRFEAAGMGNAKDDTEKRSDNG